jgi:hypothetical protein
VQARNALRDVRRDLAAFLSQAQAQRIASAIAALNAQIAAAC